MKTPYRVLSFLCVGVLVGSVIGGISFSEDLVRGETGDKDIVLIRDVEDKELEHIRDLQGVEVIDQYGRYLLVETGEDRVPNLEKEFDVDRLDHRNDLHVKGTSFDTTEGYPDFDPDLMIDEYEPKTEGLYIIDMVGPVNPEWREALEDRGVEIVNYVPNYGFEVRMTPEQADRVEDEFFIEWVDIYQPGFKLADDLEAGTINIVLVEEPKSESLNDIQEKVEVHSMTDLATYGIQVRGEVKDDSIFSELARMNDVYYISNHEEPELHDEMATQIVGGGNWIWDPDDDPYNPWRGPNDEYEFGAHVNHLGWSGDGETIAVADTGINPDHLDFQNRVSDGYYWEGSSWEDNHGHGSHVAGSAAGNTYNGTGATIDQFDFSENLGPYYAAQGPAYNSELYSAKIFDANGGWVGPNESFEIIEVTAQNSDTYIHSNSWGTTVDLGQYLENSEAYDAAVRDANRDTEENEPMVVVVATGNEGPDYNTVGAPATAKNVIAVGGTENFIPEPDFIYNDNPDNVSDFSSRGWTNDNRIKPDVTAPGGGIVSTGNEGQDSYLGMSGTSMACPTVSGSSAVVVEWYEDTYGHKPSPSMVRALLINTASDLDDDNGNTGPIPNRDEGWGMVNLPALIDSEQGFSQLEDQETLLETGDVQEYEVMYDEISDPLKVSLTWTDKEAQAGDTQVLKNDLNLEVISPTGEVFTGNSFQDGWTPPDEGAMSDFDTTGDGYDDVNNVQNVYIHPSNLEQGEYTIRVIGEDIPEDANNDGVPNQDYSLVARIADEHDFTGPLPPSDPIPEDGASDIGQDAELSVQVGHEEMLQGEKTSNDVESDSRISSHDISPGEIDDDSNSPQAEADWRWLYQGDWRAVIDTALGLPEPGVWYGAIRLNLSSDVGRNLTQVAYFNYGQNASYVQGHVAKDEGGAPGNWLASTDQHTPSGVNWVELALNQSVNIEEPGQYWVVLEVDDLGEGRYPIGAIEPFVEEGGWIAMDNPHDPGSWDTTGNQGLDFSWALEAKVPTDVYFDVEILNYDEEVMEGETVTVEYRVTNVGEVEGTQQIELKVDGMVEDSEEVTLGGGQNHTSDLNWTAGNQGEYTLAVASDNEEEEVPVIVDHPSDFQVEIQEYDEEVVENEMVSVNYSVTNVGVEQGTQDIEFKVNGELEESRELTLQVDEDETGEFTWMPGEPGDFTLEVSSNDDLEEVTVNVLPTMEVKFYDASDDSLIGTVDEVACGERASLTWEGLDSETSYEWYAVADDGQLTAESDIWSFTTKAPSNFEVEIVDIDDEIVVGEEAWVSYEVTNTGEATDVQDIEFFVDGNLTETEGDVELPVGESYEGNFTWTQDETGMYSLEIFSRDDSATHDYSVLEPPYFEIEVDDHDEDVASGGNLSIDYTVTNTGQATGEQEIEFFVDDNLEDTHELELASGAEEQNQFTWETEEGDTGEHQLEIVSEDSADNASAMVVEPPAFDVEIVSSVDEVVEGETITIDYEVTNTGDVEATQSIEIRLNGVIEEREDVTLGPGEVYEGEFSWMTEEGDSGENIVEISSPDRDEGVIVTVLQDAFFEVEIISPEEGEEFTEGEEITVVYEVRNTGDVTGEQDVHFYVNDELLKTEENVAIDGNETYEGEFTWQTEEGDSGDYDIRVETEDDEYLEREALTINEGFDIFGGYWWIFIVFAVAVILVVLVVLKKRGGEEEEQEGYPYQGPAVAGGAGSQSYPRSEGVEGGRGQSRTGPSREGRAAAAPMGRGSEGKMCSSCGSQLRWIDEYEMWYCERCQEYK
ncbi:MAG: S8 family serine peptidase [Candidatus Thermoplasmatota archaeon]